MLLKGITIALTVACVAALELPRDQIVPEDEDLLEHIPGFVSSLAHSHAHNRGNVQLASVNPEANRIRASTVAWPNNSAPMGCGSSKAFEKVSMNCCTGDAAVRTDISRAFFGGGSCYYSQGPPFQLSGFGKCDATNHFIYGELCHNHSAVLPGYPEYPHPPREEQKFTNPTNALQCGCALDKDYVHFNGNTDCTYGCHRVVRTPPRQDTCWRITDFTQQDVLTSLKPARDSGRLVIPPAFDPVFTTQFFLHSQGCVAEN